MAFITSAVTPVRASHLRAARVCAISGVRVAPARSGACGGAFDPLHRAHGQRVSVVGRARSRKGCAVQRLPLVLRLCPAPRLVLRVHEQPAAAVDPRVYQPAVRRRKLARAHFLGTVRCLYFYFLLSFSYCRVLHRVLLTNLE